MLDNKTVVPPRGFESQELLARVNKAQQQMQADEVGALLLTTEADIYYFTGYLTQFWQSPTRPWYVVIPSSGLPIAVIPEIGVNCMTSDVMQDVRSWSSPDPDDDGESLLLETLCEVISKSEYQAVGTNLARETHVRMPMNHFLRLKSALQQQVPAIQITDATELIRKLRMVKSEAEIDKLRYVAGCASSVFEMLPSILRVGMTDDEVFRTFRIECLKAGVDDVSFLVGAADQGGYDDIISPPSGKTIQHGDVLILDTGCTFDGYFCDFDRNFAFTHADAVCQRAYETVWQATEAGLAKASPGNTCADLFNAMDEVMQKGGALGQTVGRYGHGLGIQLTEPPSHTSWDNTVLEPGMVITLEPGMVFAPGKMMVHEENLVIREHGPELLSRRAAAELPIIK